MRGERIEAAGAVGVVKAGAETTGGAFSLSEVTLAPGFAGPPPHLHRGMTDTFYVLDPASFAALAERHDLVVAG